MRFVNNLIQTIISRNQVISVCYLYYDEAYIKDFRVVPGRVHGYGLKEKDETVLNVLNHMLWVHFKTNTTLF